MSLTDGFIEITSCNAYWASNTISDDFLIRTGSNAFQRLVFATMWSSNATMIMSNNIVSFASNVGIGKSNPLYSLDVDGIVNASNLYVGGAPYIGSQWTSTGSNIYITGSNVGIGTASPQATLQVSGNMQVNGSTATKGFVLTRSAGILSNYVPQTVQGYSNLSSNITLYTSGSNTTDSIIFVTGSNPISEKVRIQGNGNVGIGISNPSYMLSLRGTDSSTSGPHIAAYTSVDSYPTSHIVNWTHNNVNIALDAYYNGTSWLSSTSTGNFLLSKASGLLSFQTASNVAAGVAITWSNILSIQASSGNIGIGTTSPSYPLHVTAGAASTSIYASGDIVGLSDASVKADLIKIAGALERVKKISGYTFVRTDSQVDPVKRHAGVLAQEVVEVLPEVVSHSDGKLCVAYGNMVALLIEAIKELNEKVDALL